MSILRERVLDGNYWDPLISSLQNQFVFLMISHFQYFDISHARPQCSSVIYHLFKVALINVPTLLLLPHRGKGSELISRLRALLTKIYVRRCPPRQRCAFQLCRTTQLSRRNMKQEDQRTSLPGYKCTNLKCSTQMGQKDTQFGVCLHSGDN